MMNSKPADEQLYVNHEGHEEKQLLAQRRKDAENY